MAPAHDGTLWAMVTRTAIVLWRMRPSHVVAAVVRSEKSIDKYGENVRVVWRAGALVVQTSKDSLLFYHIVRVPGAGHLYAYSHEGQASLSPAQTSMRALFRPAPGESVGEAPGARGAGDAALQIVLRHAVQVDAGLASVAVVDSFVLVGTRSPRAVQVFEWPPTQSAPQSTLLDSLEWVGPGTVSYVTYSRAMMVGVWITQSGSASVAMRDGDSWVGAPMHESGAMCAAINARFSLIAVGHRDAVSLYAYQTPDVPPVLVRTLHLAGAGEVNSMSWTGDGHALAVAFATRVAVWSTFGYLLFDGHADAPNLQDGFLRGARHVFWGPGATELFILPHEGDETPVYVLPSLKSASTSQLLPDHAHTAFLQGDDSVYIYRGHEQLDLCVIAPENDTWRHVCVPPSYLAANWPIRYASISGDGRFVAVAGRRGLVHYSCTSGRWKTYASAAQEQSFYVRGGLVWFQHVLIAACDCDGEYQLRVYSRDAELNNTSLLDLQLIPDPIVVTAIFDTSVLVYTAGNILFHFLVVPTRDRIRLELCGSISFDGVIGEPARVRALSWMVPPEQQQNGDPAQDLTHASVIFLVDGRLVLLRPRRVHGAHGTELSYDLQILHDCVETYWTNLQGRDTLHNSLWGFDGNVTRVWLDVLSLGSSDVAGDYGIDAHAVIPASAYPLTILLSRALVIGAESSVTLRRTLDSATFRLRTSTAPFLHHVLKALLASDMLRDAVFLAAHYRGLVYFGHILELLMHEVLDEEASAKQRRKKPLLPAVGRLIDHFDVALSVTAQCARKTEVSHWQYLFGALGAADVLVGHAISRAEFDTAVQLLLVVYELQPTLAADATARVLVALNEQSSWDLFQQVLSFLQATDEDGKRVKDVLRRAASLSRAHRTDSLRDTPLGSLARTLAENGQLDEPSAPRFPTSVPSLTPRSPVRSPARSLAPSPSPASPSAETLRRAVRHASLSAKPPVVQKNGRLVLPGV
ncbi:WD40 repeat protein [Malassezia cuniculi]|uniref:WD40 repeat protein n=1 Tax=Malassezia cuniculi TaxID=948313 RepID=A0AAF0JAE2_9BASI|nr:WD40 repeat protein [Malassezia cuniculi]